VTANPRARPSRLLDWLLDLNVFLAAAAVGALVAILTLGFVLGELIDFGLLLTGSGRESNRIKQLVYMGVGLAWTLGLMLFWWRRGTMARRGAARLFAAGQVSLALGHGLLFATLSSTSLQGMLLLPFLGVGVAYLAGLSLLGLAGDTRRSGRSAAER
jgi:hypothetical protein